MQEPVDLLHLASWPMVAKIRNYPDELNTLCHRVVASVTEVCPGIALLITAENAAPALAPIQVPSGSSVVVP